MLPRMLIRCISAWPMSLRVISMWVYWVGVTVTSPSRITRSGPLRIQLCRRLGEDWSDLADYFGIPAHRRRRFTPGRECHDIATGGIPANEYPWGAEWDSSRANTYESNLNRSTAVGMYPHGASPVGALDLSGNVWEWCLNEYDNPKRVDLSGDARRVVRGGSWNALQVVARAAFRRFHIPAERNNLLGFRVVCSSPL